MLRSFFVLGSLLVFSCVGGCSHNKPIVLTAGPLDGFWRQSKLECETAGQLTELGHSENERYKFGELQGIAHITGIEATIHYAHYLSRKVGVARCEGTIHEVWEPTADGSIQISGTQGEARSIVDGPDSAQKLKGQCPAKFKFERVRKWNYKVEGNTLRLFVGSTWIPGSDQEFSVAGVCRTGRLVLVYDRIL